jgi:hypothetical protein
MNKTLKERAPRIIVHDAANEPDDSAEEASAQDSALKIDWGVLDRP